MTFLRFLIVTLILVASPAFADGLSADRARDAVLKGEIEPLSKVLGVIETRFPGTILEVELEREGGGYIYEIKVLGDEGRVVEVEMDAKTLDILKVEDD